jgi:hypothetical protein
VKTPEEIKKGLAEAPHIQYRMSTQNDSDGHSTRYAVAIGYGFRDEIVGCLQQLESELEAVKRERDAAVRDFESFAQFKNSVCHYRVAAEGMCGNCGWRYPNLFTWRGVCQENTEVQDDG